MGEIYKIKGLLDKLDLLGCLVKKGIISDSLAIEEYGGAAILKCWYQLKEYIDERRVEQGIYCKYVEYLAKMTVTYQLKNEPKKEWIRFWIGDLIKREQYAYNLVHILRHELIPSRVSLLVILIIRFFKVVRLKQKFYLFRVSFYSLFHRYPFSVLRLVLKE